jgi:hypothetical protein
MVVEVAEASAGPDREMKGPHYGKAGIREAWRRDPRVIGWRGPSSSRR